MRRQSIDEKSLAANEFERGQVDFRQIGPIDEKVAAYHFDCAQVQTGGGVGGETDELDVSVDDDTPIEASAEASEALVGRGAMKTDRRAVVRAATRSRRN